MNRKPKGSQENASRKLLFVELWNDQKTKNFLPIRVHAGETALQIQVLLERALSGTPVRKRKYNVIDKMPLYFLRNEDPYFEYKVAPKGVDGLLAVQFKGQYVTLDEIRRAPNGLIVPKQPNLYWFLQFENAEEQAKWKQKLMPERK